MDFIQFSFTPLDDTDGDGIPDYLGKFVLTKKNLSVDSAPLVTQNLSKKNLYELMIVIQRAEMLSICSKGMGGQPEAGLNSGYEHIQGWRNKDSLLTFFYQLDR